MGQHEGGLSAQAEIRAANSSEALGGLSSSLVFGRIQLLAAVKIKALKSTSTCHSLLRSPLQNTALGSSRPTGERVCGFFL